MGPRVGFYGAAGGVTGAKFLVECDGGSILLDCGIFQGRDQRMASLGGDLFPFSVDSLSSVVLSHAHLDHSGALPLLVRAGFRGPIYCSEATKELLHVVLTDAYRIQREAYLSSHYRGRDSSISSPIYGRGDLRRTLSLLRAVAVGRELLIAPRTVLRLDYAGHILGAVSISLEVGGRRIVYSGDLGRYGAAILPDPRPLERGDLLLCESTYADGEHPENGRRELVEILRRTRESGGTLLIPSFAVGRVQAILYELASLERCGEIEPLEVFVDSSMAVEATAIYRRNSQCFDEEALCLRSEGEGIFSPQKVHFCRTLRESRAIASLGSSKVIISPSGMLSGGRVLEHLADIAGEERATILFVGFQAPGTLGEFLSSRPKYFSLFGERRRLRARVEALSHFSAHADREELIRWLESCGGSPGLVKIVHGRAKTAESFASLLRERYSWRASAAKYSEVLEVP